MLISSEVWTVSRLTTEISRLIEGGLPFLWVEGEIGEFRLHSPSGNRYFTLKDETAQIACVMWRSRPPLDFTPKEGLLVRVFGKVTTYVPRSQYQLDVYQMIPVGLGTLQERFEALKRKLHAEGLFDLSRKKPLPRFPRAIGIVTSPSGAAIYDFIWTFLSRYPPLDLYLIPVSVQGETAAEEISKAIYLYNELGVVDIIVVGRGGGSLEDLWAFNEEEVVRAVASSRIPVVSAVGHEVDVTLCDLAADLRAPTPASAGNVVVPDRQELLESLKSLGHRLNQALSRTIALWRERVSHIAQGYGFKRLILRIGEERRRLDDIAERIVTALSQTILRRREWLNLQSQRLSALSPLAVLERGYCLARKEDHTLVREAKELAIEEKIFLHFAHDRAKVSVEEVMV